MADDYAEGYIKNCRGNEDITWKHAESRGLAQPSKLTALWINDLGGGDPQKLSTQGQLLLAKAIGRLDR